MSVWIRRKNNTMKLFENQDLKNKLITELKNSIVTITFKKLNGDIRNMECTLAESYLPVANKNDKMSQRKIREISPEVLCVWDINKNDWRSMRWDNIMEVSHNEQQTERTNQTSTS